MRFFVIIGLLLLAGCTNYGGSGLRPGVDGREEVVRLMGAPAMEWSDADGARQLAYPRGPMGAHTYMAFIGPDGKLQRIENVLTLEFFSHVRRGMNMDQVLRLLGPPEPSWTAYFKARDELVWEWRYCDDWSELARFDVALEGLDFNSVDVYVGVSAGGFVAAGLVNGFTPHQMSRVFIEGEKTRDRFEPSVLLKPAYREYAQRLASVPPLLASAIWHYVLGSSTVMSAFERLGRAIPTGVFSGEEVDRYFSGIFSQPDRSNDFRKLSRKLYLVATDLDTGESVIFGTPGLDHVPISRAVQATSALPGLFPPVEIEVRYFVDGALRKTLHASAPPSRRGPAP